MTVAVSGIHGFDGEIGKASLALETTRSKRKGLNTWHLLPSVPHEMRADCKKKTYFETFGT